eukprot:g2818.t1
MSNQPPPLPTPVSVEEVVDVSPPPPSLPSDSASKTICKRLLSAASVGQAKEVANVLESPQVDNNFGGSADGHTALMQAIRSERDAKSLRNMANVGYINVQDDHGATALMFAATKGTKDTVELLVQKGANADLRYKDGRTALIIAAQKGYVEVAKLLLNSGDASIRLKDSSGKTALHWAASQGHSEVVRFLVSKDVNLVEIKDDQRRTAHDIAVARGHMECAKIIASAANIAKDLKERQSHQLILAIKEGRTNDAMNFIQEGADINARSTESHTALHCAILAGNEALALVLIHKKDIICNAKDAHGATALLFASTRGKPEIVDALLRKEANCELAYEDGRTPLISACQQGYVTIVQMLVDLGKANVDVQDDSGKSALHWAAALGRLDIVKKLYEYNADVTLQDKKGRLAVDLAIKKKRNSVVQWMKSKESFFSKAVGGPKGGLV